MNDLHTSGDRYLAQVIAAARQRLIAQQFLIAAEMQALEKQLAVIARQEIAIDAYESVKAGKPTPRLSSRRPRKRLKLGLLALIREHGGMRLHEIRQEMGLKSGSPQAGSVSNALFILKKRGRLLNDGGVWRIPDTEHADYAELLLEEAAN